MNQKKSTAQEAFERQVGRIIGQVRCAEHLGEVSPLFPQHVHIEPTNACNLRCIHCIQDTMRRPRGLMDFDVYTRVIDEIAPLCCALTLDVQGEPLLHPRILDMVRYAKEAGCHISLLTNATRLTAERSRALVDMGLDRAVFSFDAVDRALYERIRQRGSYGRVLGNILEFLRINQESGRPVFVCASIIRQNATRGHIAAYQEYFKDLPVDAVFVSELLNMSGHSRVAGEIDLTDLRRKADSEPVCRVPWENITVNWNGDVCPCPLDFEVSWPAGNVRGASLQEIWNSPVYREFRRKHMKGDLSGLDCGHALCSTCNCRFDPEYDIQRYAEFAIKAIVRRSEQYARFLTAASTDLSSSESTALVLAQRIAALGLQPGQVR